MGSKKYDAKNEKSTFPLFFFTLSLFSLYILTTSFTALLLLFYWSSTAHLLFIYCYYSIRTIYFKLNDSFYTREGAEIY